MQDIHSHSLATSTAISAYYYPSLITPLEVIAVLNAANIHFMLIGTHAIGGWMDDPRCSADVDVLTALGQHKEAAEALHIAFPHLILAKQKNSTQLRHADDTRLAVKIFPSSRRGFRFDRRYVHEVNADGEVFLIPSLELAIAMKFASMTSPTSELPDQYLDAHDFLSMIKANPTLDLQKLAAVGKWIPQGGVKELLHKVRRVLAGDRFTL